MTLTVEPGRGAAAGAAQAARGRSPRPGRRWVMPLVLTIISLIWLFPLLLALVNSFRDYAYTAQNGYMSWGGFTLDNYKNAWEQGDFGLHFWNSLIITVPAVVLTLFLSACVAFVVARFSWKFNLALLGFFMAANLLPPQALLIPVYRMFRVDRGARSGSASRAPCSTASRASSSSTSPSRPASAPSCSATT